MHHIYNEEFVSDLGVLFTCNNDDDEPRTFLVTLDVLEKLSGSKRLVNSKAVSLTFFYHYRGAIFRMVLTAFRDTPVWTNDKPYPLTVDYLNK